MVCVCMCVGLNACVSMCQYNHNIKIHKHLLIPSYFSQLYQSGNDGIKIGFIISQISHLTHQMMIYIFLYIINHISFKASNPKKSCFILDILFILFKFSYYTHFHIKKLLSNVNDHNLMLETKE